MVRKYVRKTERQVWSDEHMQVAINALANKEMGAPKAAKQFNAPQTTLEGQVAINALANKEMGAPKAAKQFNAPQTTLEGRFKVFRKNPNMTAAAASTKSLGAFKTVFSSEQEQDILTQ
ncbi:CENP-B N-terminal DNA-binding domain [Popillia japonica]|uniref:CENP-B N-terminal DNA-binding domain n=1 Tax=Popillia japonica TaxID=7064 RepID=A0AAW1MGA0_POPJA